MTRYTVRDEGIAASDLDGEVVVLNLDTDHYYGLDPTASAAWRILDAGSASAPELAAHLRAAFATGDADVETDVADLVQRLLDAGLITPSDAAPAPALAAETTGAYTRPTIESYDSLGTLMLSGE